ncbi:MAG: Hsp20/alpha crystallin family protein, partial [Acidobacteriota bacterium]|nr:Hsp20/alpha crystallin family protein [Acidobacteriota bacterium]
AVQRAPSSGALRVVEPQALLERMSRIHDDIARRAFELFERDGAFGRDLENWFDAEEQLVHPVHVNISETDSALRLQAEVPGFEPSELEISLEPSRLTISGKKESTQEQPEKGKVVYKELCSCELLRVIDLPVEVDPDKTKATLKNGVLELEIPKAAGAQSKRIEVRAA